MAKVHKWERCCIVPTFGGIMAIDFDQGKLHELFQYKDGNLIWRESRRKARAGNVAGRKKSNGYCEVHVNGRLHGTHRIIFMMFHGYMPKIIDHIDGDPSNNKIENLREASIAQNAMNSKKPSNNTSGFKGVYFCNRTNKWVAQCWALNTKHNLGHFQDIQDAAKAVSDFRNSHHGEFANNG